ncbi:uncharacterized protein LOC143635583 [Bidens hawaiensis]|uniref:uncharacterized protein LOC143635583 n=1 Tax=Bidens hawaiensis TaxID=980011 RepID=UPI00404A6692
MRTNRKDLSTKLTNALWAYRTTYKMPIETTPVNTSYDEGKARKLALCEIKELQDEAYECALAYKEKIKKVHDSKIRLKYFEVGQKVWLYNTRMKLFPVNSKASGWAHI